MAGLVGVGVLAAGVPVLDVDGLDVHGERRSTVVGLTTGPFDGAGGVFGVTAGPDTDPEASGGLGEASATLGLVAGQSADVLAVDEPGDLLGRPCDGVCVEDLLGGGHRLVSSAVVAGGVAFAKVVGLDLSGITPKSFLHNTRQLALIRIRFAH